MTNSLFCNCSVKADLTNISLDLSECGLINRPLTSLHLLQRPLLDLMRFVGFFTLLFECIDLAIRAETLIYTKQQKMTGDAEDSTFVFVGVFLRQIEIQRDIGGQGEKKTRVKRCDLERRGLRADRQEGTANAALKMRCQICCEGSPGLHCGGQHKAVTEGTRTGQQDCVTLDHKHTNTHTNVRCSQIQ